jgi:hypothetical protein
MYCTEHVLGGATCASEDACRKKAFRDVLAACAQPLQDETLKRTRKLKREKGVLHQAVANFDLERNLSCRFWYGLINAINRVPDEVNGLCGSIRKYMRSALFQGPTARLPAGVTLGRATSRKDLVAHFRTRKYFPDKLSASLSIDEVMSVPVEDARRKWGMYDLGTHVMWSTFDPAGGRPFERPGLTARVIRAILGLGGWRSRHPVLTLEFQLDARQSAYLPTVAEAYAGNKWLSLFRPSGVEEILDGYSWTQPPDAFASRYPGMPEVVHAPVSGAALVHPPTEIR